ncbi:MAG TPA: family 16 glycosylhydrolase [Candidatus Sulfotelmatobacter sp.]|nr:family 16 glycosylhydrolase [Candidatus Sulfotelmatobacter sp.]
MLNVEPFRDSLKAGHRASLLYVLLLTGVLFLPACVIGAPPPGYYLVWDSEFTGTSLDTTKWGYRLPGAERDAYDTPNAISFNGSNLVITTYTEGGTNFSCQLYTEKKFESKFGYWESDIEWGDSNGTWSAFWMLPPSQTYSASTYIDLDEPQVSGSEIDICEHRYVDGSGDDIDPYIQVNLHYYDGSTTEKNDPGSPLSPSSGGLQTGYHTYGFLWTANAYSFLIDGSQVYTAPTSPVSHSCEYALLDTAVDDTSTTWAGYIPSGGYGSQATSPTQMKVAYVRYYAPTNVLFWTGASTKDWNDDASWYDNLLPATNSDLTFSYLCTANNGMYLGQNYSVDGLIFLTCGSAFSVSGVSTLTLGAGGVDMTAASANVTLNAPIVIAANQTWGVGLNRNNDAALDLIVNSSLSGSATLTKSCYGTMVLDDSNSFSGTLNVDTGSSSNNDGTVIIENPAAVSNLAGVFINNTATGVSALQLSNNVAIPCSVSLAGRNVTNVPIESLAGNNSLGGGLTLTGGGSNYWLQSDAGTLSIGGTVSAGTTATDTRTLTFQGAGNFLVSASIANGSSSALNVLNDSSGALTFSGVNTYTGTTTNLSGTLFVNGSLAGLLTIGGGIFSGSGTIGGNTLVESGCEISPGTAVSDSIGTLSFGGNLTLASGSTTYLEINAAAGANDQLAVAGTLNRGGVLTVENIGGAFAAGQAFQLFNAHSYTGSFSAITLPSLSAGLAWNTNNLANGALSVIGVSPAETLSVANSQSGQLQLNWEYGTLQTATNVAGPYSDISNAAAPFEIVPTNAQQFYRIREN